METSSAPENLEARFLQPEGWRWHYFRNPQGRRIRFGTVAPQSRIPDAVVVCLQGLSEFSEKYYELAHDMLGRNLSFWIMDWQGQGYSDRHLKNPHKRHTNSFKEDVADLHYFINEYIKHSAVHPDVGRIPLVMLGHSMGGNIGLHYLSQYPDVFSCAAFSAPLVGIKALTNIPAWLRVGTTAAFNTTFGKFYVFGGSNWHPEIRDEKAKAMLSSDPARRSVQDQWCIHDSALQVGHVTFGWLHEANMSCARLFRPDVASKIKVPCLMALAGEDRLVDNEATRRLAQSMPQAEILELEGAMHEIFMERDDIRNRFLDAFDELLSKQELKTQVKPF